MIFFLMIDLVLMNCSSGFGLGRVNWFSHQSDSLRCPLIGTARDRRGMRRSNTASLWRSPAPYHPSATNAWYRDTGDACRNWIECCEVILNERYSVLHHRLRYLFMQIHMISKISLGMNRKIWLLLISKTWYVVRHVSISELNWSFDENHWASV